MAEKKINNADVKVCMIFCMYVCNYVCISEED